MIIIINNTINNINYHKVLIYIFMLYKYLFIYSFIYLFIYLYIYLLFNSIIYYQFKLIYE